MQRALLSVALFGLSVSAITLEKREDGSPKVVGFQMERREVLDPHAHDLDRLRKRAGTVQASLNNQETLYYVNASLGTPAQNFQLHIDTGSSDLWVNTASSDFCSKRQDPCSFSGTYDANSSSTYQYVNSDFNITYADSSGASGDYATDTLRLGGTTIQDMEFGIGYVSSSAQGIMGIGYAINEAIVTESNDKTYQNLPEKLAADKVISSTAYSLWLNDLDASTGNILFGGVDRAQYEGELQTVPIQSEDGVNAEFLIALQKVEFDNTNLGDNLGIAVLLDSGTSLTYLPTDIVADIYEAVSARFDQEGNALVPCSLANQDVNMTFTFADNLSIDVPLNELVLGAVDIFQQPDGNGDTSDATQACRFGVSTFGNNNYVLGDTFLRSAYVVFDLANNEVSLAQSRFNATGSDIAEIGSGSDAVPSAVTASGVPSATVGVPAPSATSTQGSDNLGSRALSPDLGPVVAALGVGVGIVAFMV